MRTTHRKIPNDLCSTEHNGRYLQVWANENRFLVELFDGPSHQAGSYTFDQFYGLLQGLLIQHTLSPPSPDDKEAATALHGAEKGVL